jgi:serine phosphatase RsbU (regulator of sigma subunit)
VTTETDKLQTTEQANVQALVDNLNAQGWNLANSEPQQSLELATQTQMLAQASSYQNGLAFSRLIAAKAHFIQATYDLALTEAQTALDLYHDLANPKGEIAVLHLFANIYRNLCDYPDALDFSLRALAVSETNNLQDRIVLTLVNIAAIYFRMEDYTTGLEHYQKGLVIAQEIDDKPTQANVLNGIGLTYLEINQAEQALQYLQQAQQIATEINNQYLLANIYDTLGTTHQQLGDYSLANDLLKQAQQIFEKSGIKRALVEVLLHLGDNESASGHYEQAKTYYEQVLGQAQECEATDWLYQAHLACSKVYEALGDFSQSLQHYKLFSNIRAAVLSEDNKKVMAASQARFNLEKTEREREIFRLRTIELAGALEQVEVANLEIASLNTQLQSENLRMSAELKVTQKLQELVLPGETELSQVPGLDIASFMQPADEVGGDYYDVLREGNRVKIGIGDVTGHGLESGVLMLMVQTAVRTLLATPTFNPVEFLSIINKTIYNNVQRMGTPKNLTLSLLDYQNQHLQMSGQHEEIIIVRNNGRLELVDTMGLGFPIGLIEDISHLVDLVEIVLESGDVVVLYTDGIPEAENLARESYGLKRLCHKVQACYKCSAAEIKDAVIEDVLSFIGNQKIFDDITLLVLKQR